MRELSMFSQKTKPPISQKKPFLLQQNHELLSPFFSTRHTRHA